jgi:hypothetical protein
LTIVDQAICFLVALALYSSTAITFHFEGPFPREQAAGALALAAPVMSAALVFGALADGVGGGGGGALRSV